MKDVIIQKEDEKRKVGLSPSILAAKLLELPNTFKILNKFPISSIHIDVMDGQFVPNLTIGPSVVAEIRKLSNIPFYVHLMILTPEKLIVDFLNAGADMLIPHIEATFCPIEIIDMIKNRGKKVGIAINPKTDVKCLNWLARFLDAVLVMTVNPGFYGQGMIKEALNKIKHIRDVNPQVEIIVDGGIKLANLSTVLAYQPDTIVSSSEIFLSDNIEKTIEKFLTSLT